MSDKPKSDDYIKEGFIEFLDVDFGNGKKIGKLRIDHNGDHERELATAQALMGASKSDNNVKPESEKRFSELSQAYLADCISDGTKKTATDAYERSLKQFTDVEGDMLLSEITRETMRGFLNKLQRLPSSHNNKKEYKNKSIATLLTLKNVPVRSASTIGKEMGRISSCLGWGVREEWIRRNYAEGLGQKNIKKNSTSYSPFEPDDLVKLFGSKNYQNQTFRKHSFYWLPLLGLFTGARLSELVQMRVRDVKESDMVMMFHIVEDESNGLSTKTDAGVRRVPVHSFLIKQGFLLYLQNLQTRREDRILPDYKQRKSDGSWSDDPSKKFTAYRRKCGILGSREKVFHSFRHTVINRLTQEGKFPNEHIQELIGHETGVLMYDVYSHGLPAKKLQEIVETLDFEKHLPDMPPWQSGLNR
ncbi:MAG: site-specific integrase [Magnetococcales bacterium]|nr:site-specific integrase [Magnetococcales bacterium]